VKTECEFNCHVAQKKLRQTARTSSNSANATVMLPSVNDQLQVQQDSIQNNHLDAIGELLNSERGHTSQWVLVCMPVDICYNHLAPTLPEIIYVLHGFSVSAICKQEINF
jgi:hypothetical protein